MKYFIVMLLTVVGCAGTHTRDDHDGRRFLPLERPAWDDRRVTPELPFCFSPTEDCAAKLVAFMATAQLELAVAIYDLNEPRITAAILDAAKRGVKTRVVCDKRQTSEKNSSIKQLVAAGIPVKYGHQSGGIMHNKFTVVDADAVETGSFNYTNHATKQNHENQFYIRDAGVVANYRMEFMDMWDRGEPVPAKLGAGKKESPF